MHANMKLYMYVYLQISEYVEKVTCGERNEKKENFMGYMYMRVCMNICMHVRV